MKNKQLLLLSALLLVLGSCGTVKPYEMVYLNDGEMQMGNSSAKNFENYVQSIREGSSGAGSNKSSGGCGCN